MIKILICLLIFSSFFTAVAAADDNPVEKFSFNSGREIYDSNCKGCHGEKGDGSGLKGAFDFTDKEIMKSKNSSEFFEAVTNGVRSTAMPSFEKLSISERWDVTAYLWTFWMYPDEIETGKTIYQRNCAQCHGVRGDGSGVTGAFDFTDVSSMIKKEPELLFSRITDGVEDTSMPSWKDSLTEDERWDTVKYTMIFQFKDYLQIQTPLRTPDIEKASSGEKWYSSLSGMAIIAVSILLAIIVLYLFEKGMKER